LPISILTQATKGIKAKTSSSWKTNGLF